MNAQLRVLMKHLLARLSMLDCIVIVLCILFNIKCFFQDAMRIEDE